MEKLESNEGQKPLVPYEQSFALATELMQKHHDLLVLADNENFGHADTAEVIREIPEIFKRRFYGHGITRIGKHGTNADKLAAFINILDNDTIIGDYGPLIGGQFGAWHGADLLILSHADTHLGVPKELLEMDKGWCEAGMDGLLMLGLMLLVINIIQY